MQRFLCILVIFIFVVYYNVGGIAQSVERWSNKPLVAGSIPSVTITLLPPFTFCQC